MVVEGMVWKLSKGEKLITELFIVFMKETNKLKFAKNIPPFILINNNVIRLNWIVNICVDDHIDYQ